MSDLRFIQSSFTGDGVFRDKKADFETTYILKKQMKSLYPAGGYTGEQALVTMERLYNKLHQ